LATACGGDRYARGKTLGYVLASNDYRFYSTPGAKEECPHGFTPNAREEWEAQFPTPAAQQAHLSKCLGINNRGSNCENVWASPQSVKDPIPYRPVEGKLSYGANLDGTDGAGTAKTCAHENFTSPDGETGVDNQYYRFVGCERFVQGGQQHGAQQASKRTIQFQVNRILLEVRGVRDERNDDDVEVVVYRGKDPLIVDADEHAVAWQSQRVDPTIPPVRLHGRIVDGVLITDPMDAIFEDVLFERRQLVRDMTLKLKLKGDHAEGMRLGYIDLDDLWQSYSRTAKWGGKIYGSSGPAAYAALHQLADGGKDPRSGQCTSLSSAKGYDFVRAFVVHPSEPGRPAEAAS